MTIAQVAAPASVTFVRRFDVPYQVAVRRFPPLRVAIWPLLIPKYNLTTC